MKNLRLPLKQSAGYIYDTDVILRMRVFNDTMLPYQVNELADVTITALNRLLPNIEAIRTLNDSINKIDMLVMNMDKSIREDLDRHIEAAHKAYKTIFTEGKLLSTIHKVTN